MDVPFTANGYGDAERDVDAVGEAQPVAASNAPRMQTTPVRVKTAEDGHAAGPLVVVDDDEWVTDTITTLLELHGFSVWTYNSAAQFLADRRRDETQCLIIDQHMPGIQGLDAIAALHSEALFPPAILITGRLDAAISSRAGELGVKAILEKPFRVERLVTLIRSLLDDRPE